MSEGFLRHDGYQQPDVALRAAELAVGKQARSLCTALGWLARGFKHFGLPFWTAPSQEDLLRVLMWVYDESCSSEFIKKIQTVCSHLSHIRAVCQDASAKLIRAFFLDHSRRAKVPRYDHFWDVTEFLRQLRPVALETFQRCSVATKALDCYDHTLMGRIRSIAVILIRIAMIGRTTDVSNIKDFKWTRPSSTFPDGVLWILTRRKQRTYRWFPILPAEDSAVCPVRAYLWYVKYSRLSSSWSSRPTHGTHGEYLSVWRHQKAPHGGLSLDRLSNIVKDLLRECGVDTSVWTAATVRGATASTALAHGIPAAAVMDAGDWTSSIVFNAYYNRSGRSVNWVDVLTSALRMNSASSGTADDRADISSMFSEVVSDIRSNSVLSSVLRISESQLQTIEQNVVAMTTTTDGNDEDPPTVSTEEDIPRGVESLPSVVARPTTPTPASSSSSSSSSAARVGRARSADAVPLRTPPTKSRRS